MSVPAIDAPSLPATTTVGTVRLTVSDLASSQAFYERILGLEASALDDGGVALFGAGGRAAGASAVRSIRSADPSVRPSWQQTASVTPGIRSATWATRFALGTRSRGPSPASATRATTS